MATETLERGCPSPGPMPPAVDALASKRGPLFPPPSSAPGCDPHVALTAVLVLLAPVARGPRYHTGQKLGGGASPLSRQRPSKSLASLGDHPDPQELLSRHPDELLQLPDGVPAGKALPATRKGCFQHTCELIALSL